MPRNDDVGSEDDNPDAVDDSHLCDENEPMSLSPRQKDWQTIPEALRRSRQIETTGLFGGDFMQLPADKVLTMDAVSKCWKTIPRDSPLLLTEEIDGGTWTFCEPCVAQLPKMLQSFLYFFHVIQASVEDLKHYALPSRNVTLGRKRGEMQKIQDLIWHRPADPAPARAPGVRSGADLDMNDLMCPRRAARGGDVTIMKIPLMKIRLGFTGAVYKHNGEEHRKLIAVLAVTWARNWDMLTYIKDFLRDVSKKTTCYKSRFQEVKQLKFIWKMMARYMAFDNLGLDEARVGLPEDFAEQPDGRLGMDTLCNVFQIPFQVAGIIKQEILEKARRTNPRLTQQDIQLDFLDIVGLPRLSLKAEEVTLDFIAYMHAHVANVANERRGLTQHLKVYYKPKSKEEKQDNPDDIDEAPVTSFQLDCAGAWPLERSEEGLYCKFGLPPLPLWLSFCPETVLDSTISQENWLVEIGGPNGIPELTKTCLRSFLVQDLGASQASIYQTWEHFLRDKRPANPSLVLQEYYGERADPLGGLVTAGYLRAWWLGVKQDIQAQRKNDLDRMSVQDATQSLRRYLMSSIYYHKSSIHSGAMRSTRIVQALQIVEKIDFRSAYLPLDSTDRMLTYAYRSQEGDPGRREPA